MTNKLIVKHFPHQMNLEERENFLKHFGATQVICFPDIGKMRYSAFAYFPDHFSAAYVLRQLHQVVLFESRLKVEFSEASSKNAFEDVVKLSSMKKQNDLKIEMKKFQDYLNFISPSLHLNYKLSPLLKYKYPPPNKSIVNNISQALFRHQLFYIQVLHLMNKLNLMPPFEMSSSTFNQFENLQTDSEYESESDTSINKSHKTLVEVFKRKRKKLKTGILNQKKIKLSNQKSAKINDKKLLKSHDIFETTTLSNKAINIQINSQHLDNSKFSSSRDFYASTHGFGIIESSKTPNNKEEIMLDQNMSFEFISQEELKAGIIDCKEWSNYSALKDYKIGSPSSRLYIKNLHKSVIYDDLKRIFGRYVNWNCDQERNMFYIQLFTEGKMRGQAFVSLPSEKAAQLAINDTNSFLLKDKPMVVCFARSAKLQSK